MQHDARRSERPQEETERAEPAAKGGVGFARSLFRFGGKRDKREAEAEQARLHDRLKEVLERDRALVASEPPETDVLELAHEDVELQELHSEEPWPDPFGASDPEADTATRERHPWQGAQPTAGWTGSALDEPFSAPAQTAMRPTKHGLREEFFAGPTSAQRLSQIASWIEEEISDEADGAGALAMDAPLDDDEAAELDAVLAGSSHVRAGAVRSTPQAQSVAPASAAAPGREVPPPGEEAPAEESSAPTPTPAPEARPAVGRAGPVAHSAAAEPQAAVARSSGASQQPAAVPAQVAQAPTRDPAPRARPAPSSRAQVKAKVSARPAPPVAPASSEPINTLTMARLLALQGYKPRALAVYRELLKRTPEDGALRAEFEALKASD